MNEDTIKFLKEWGSEIFTNETIYSNSALFGASDILAQFVCGVDEVFCLPGIKSDKFHLYFETDSDSENPVHS